MRITNSMISKNLLSTISRNRSLATKLQGDIATTKTIRKPSDNPSAMVQIERFKRLISQNEQYLRNIIQLTGFMSTSGTALENIADNLEEAKSLATQGASETLDDGARQALAKNIDQIMDTLVSLGNTKYKDRFVFGGTITQGTNPFTRAADVVTYNGNDADVKGRIGFGIDVNYNQSGSDIFKPAGGVDIFDALATLKQGLALNDTDSIQASIDILDNAITQVTTRASESGALQNRLFLAEETIHQQNIDFADYLSTLQDTNIPETIINLQNIENAITVALRTTAEIIRTSLIDFV